MALWTSTIKPVYAEVLPWARRTTLDLYIGCYAGVIVGLLLCCYLTYAGIQSSMQTYYKMYDLLWEHGHSAVRFPLRKANSVRLLACVVFFHFVGVVLMVAVTTLGGLVVTLLVVEWDGQRFLRAAVSNSVIMLVVEMFIMRCATIPFLQWLEFGPLLFIMELW